MNRLSDLRTVMPSWTEAGRLYPPVEITIVDYNSSDGLGEYLKNLEMPEGVSLAHRRYTGRDTYHMAHAYNLAMLMGRGEYMVTVGTDHFIEPGYIAALRELAGEGCTWMNTRRKFRCVVAVQRGEFIESGGYDERFELYGPEDVDFLERLVRRGGKYGMVPEGLICSIITPPEKKTENFHLNLSHREMSERMMPFLYDSRERQALVANEGQEWGVWDS